MPRYLITYHGVEMSDDPTEVHQMMVAFQAWAGGLGAALVDPGAPLGHARTVSPGGVKEGQNEAAIGGYSMIEAADLSSAVALVENHPFVDRGGSLQVNEAVDLAM